MNSTRIKIFWLWIGSCGLLKPIQTFHFKDEHSQIKQVQSLLTRKNERKMPWRKWKSELGWWSGDIGTLRLLSADGRSLTMEPVVQGHPGRPGSVWYPWKKNCPGLQPPTWRGQSLLDELQITPEAPATIVLVCQPLSQTFSWLIYAWPIAASRPELPSHSEHFPLKLLVISHPAA